MTETKTTIKPQDLRIGNLVSAAYEGDLIVQGIAPDHIYACKEIGLPTGYYTLVSISGIPITPERLLKAGFTQDDGYADKTVVRFDFHHGMLDKTGEGWNYDICQNPEYDDWITLAKLTYWHELQNLIYTLSGKEI